jgi:hypothetical protein
MEKDEQVAAMLERLGLRISLENYSYKLTGCAINYDNEYDLDSIDRAEIVEVVNYLKSIDYSFLNSKFKLFHYDCGHFMDCDDMTLKEMDKSIKQVCEDALHNYPDRTYSDIVELMKTAGFAFEYKDMVFVFTLQGDNSLEFWDHNIKDIDPICLN